MNGTVLIPVPQALLKRVAVTDAVAARHLVSTLLEQYAERQTPNGGVTDDGTAAFGAVRLVDKAPLTRFFDQLLGATPGGPPKPIGAEALQQQMAKRGLDSNEFSVGIIAMRDE